MIQRLSSNLTLFFKFFIPIGWSTFFGLFGLVIFLSDTTDKPLLASGAFRLGYAAFFLFFFSILFFTFFRLLRVEAGQDFLVVTNYFKTVKYSFDSIKKISVYNLGIIYFVRVKLHTKGAFGKVIPFIAKTINLKQFQADNPSLFK